MLVPGPAEDELSPDLKERLHGSFYWWWYTTLILLNDSLRLFRDFADEDIIALCLCAVGEGLDELSAAPGDVPLVPADANYADIDTSRLRPVPLRVYASLTGIPTETARRKLLSCPPNFPISSIEKSSMKIDRFPAEVSSLQEFAISLARTSLRCLGISMRAVNEELETRERSKLISRFVFLMLALVRMRRVRTRDVSGVSVQSAMTLGIAQQVFNLCSRRGEILDLDFARIVRATAEVARLNRPIYLSFLEDCTGLSRERIYSTCERIREAGVLRSVDRYRILRAPSGAQSFEELSDLIYPDDVRRAGNRFINAARAAFSDAAGALPVGC